MLSNMACCCRRCCCLLKLPPLLLPLLPMSRGQTLRRNESRFYPIEVSEPRRRLYGLVRLPVDAPPLAPPAPPRRTVFQVRPTIKPYRPLLSISCGRHASLSTGYAVWSRDPPPSPSPDHTTSDTVMTPGSWEYILPMGHYQHRCGVELVESNTSVDKYETTERNRRIWINIFIRSPWAMKTR